MPEQTDLALAVLDQLAEAYATLGEWDLPPTLGMLYTIGDKIAFAPVMFAADLWTVAEAWQVLRTVGVALRDPNVPRLPVLMPGEYLGAVFVIEGYGLFGDAAAEISPEGELRRPIADNPDGIELRIISAVLRSGERLIVTDRRDGVRESRSGEADNPELTGRVFDALAYLEGGAARYFMGRN